MSTNSISPARLRALGIQIGTYPTGENNAITDVPGVRVGHTTLIQDEPAIVRTGVTIILPHNTDLPGNFVTAGYHAFNGTGEMTGMHLVEEFGLLASPIALTNTNQVGLVRDTLAAYGAQTHGGFAFKLPVVAETYDGWLNDIDAFPLTAAHVLQALETASDGPVAEGNVGGGTGMICHEFKGGIGTASRRVPMLEQEYVLGVLVQANYGSRADLRLNGVPVGSEIDAQRVPLPWQTPAASSSIVIIIACNAPLLPNQCRQLARRATVGLARVGGMGHTSSGDLFLAFSTANRINPRAGNVQTLDAIPAFGMDPLYQAVVEAVEEAIFNALTCATTMTGYQGHCAHALPLDELMRVLETYRPAKKRLLTYPNICGV